jgi:putative FmdB family regulatory protein
MPIYEYQCAACGHALETIQKFSDAPLTDCPACHKAELKKLLSAPAFRLNGAGWYETDFKTGKKKNLAGESTTSTADTAPAVASAPSANPSPTA